MAKRYKDMTPGERAAVDAVLDRRRTPAARDEAARVREVVAGEFPPIQATTELLALVAMLRDERERQGLSLAAAARLSGIDKSYLCRLENGGIPNPTLATVSRYASSLKKRVAWAVEDLEPVEH